MYKKRTLVCLLFLLFLFSACGASTSTVTSSPSPEPTTPKATPVLAPSATIPLQTPTPKPTPSVSTPVHLLIPSIGVDAPVENIGVLSNGDLATPTQHPWEDVGWYHLGARPGEMGSAVIAGHLDRPGGAPAVFWSLRDMKPGDIVTVVEAHGASLRFRVNQVASYPPNQAPLQEIFGNADGKYLNLITCAGDWIPSQHQTTLRLVVYTSLMK